MRLCLDRVVQVCPAYPLRRAVISGTGCPDGAKSTKKSDWTSCDRGIGQGSRSHYRISRPSAGHQARLRRRRAARSRHSWAHRPESSSTSLGIVIGLRRSPRLRIEDSDDTSELENSDVTQQDAAELASAIRAQASLTRSSNRSQDPNSDWPIATQRATTQQHAPLPVRRGCPFAGREWWLLQFDLGDGPCTAGGRRGRPRTLAKSSWPVRSIRLAMPLVKTIASQRDARRH